LTLIADARMRGCDLAERSALLNPYTKSSALLLVHKFSDKKKHYVAESRAGSAL
jgi:hypothetical protein